MVASPEYPADLREDNSYQSYPVSIRKDVCRLLDENPLLRAKILCKILHLSYSKYKQTVTNYRNYWKYNHENERGSKCSSVHCFRARVKLELELSKALRQRVAYDGKGEVGFGWTPSKSKNRFFSFYGSLGRVVWFETGTVIMHVRRPGNMGKAKQLFCDAFVNSGLISDFKLLNPVLSSIRPKSGHFPYSSGERLPYMVIRDFEESHGVVIKVGDRTHPDAVEVIAGFSEAINGALDKLERLERDSKKTGETLAKFTEVLSNLFGADSEKQAPKSQGGKDYVA